MSVANDIAKLRRLEKKIRAAIVGEIQKEVSPFLMPHAGYCGLVCEFFPEKKRGDLDIRHPRARGFKSPDPDLDSLIGFTDEGIIHEVYIGLSLYSYDSLSVDMLRALRPVAKRFAKERQRCKEFTP